MALKEIRAIVRPTRLFRLREAMRQIPNFPGMTILSARGFTAPSMVSRRSPKDELTDFSDKLMVIILVDSDMVEKIKSVIFDTCASGQVGDGLIWVVDVLGAWQIRSASPLDA